MVEGDSEEAWRGRKEGSASKPSERHEGKKEKLKNDAKTFEVEDRTGESGVRHHKSRLGGAVGL